MQSENVFVRLKKRTPKLNRRKTNDGHKSNKRASPVEISFQDFQVTSDAAFADRDEVHLSTQVVWEAWEAWEVWAAWAAWVAWEEWVVWAKWEAWVVVLIWEDWEQ